MQYDLHVLKYWCSSI